MTELFVLFMLVLTPALLGLSWARYSAMQSEVQRCGKIHVGDPIVYRKQKVSVNPGARAREVHPAPGGEVYYYLVDKFWTVEDVLDDGRIIAITRTKKHHCLTPNDPNLRKAKLVERLRYRSKFPHLEQAA